MCSNGRLKLPVPVMYGVTFMVGPWHAIPLPYWLVIYGPCKTCVVLYEDTTAVEKFLPSTNQVSVTAAIAVVATASAAATPLLLRVIKPIIKKATDFVKKKLGKKPYKPSRSEVEANRYRQSKGLSPLNFEKMKKKG